MAVLMETMKPRRLVLSKHKVQQVVKVKEESKCQCICTCMSHSVDTCSRYKLMEHENAYKWASVCVNSL